ncbi:uncharacterized protein L969DRAFT_20423 [Mixia osmundae IAM 14324]|uniref:C2H2-type domain-containing protein n=1 Tax=Mixia osmundae (strain CBS 9802 / IAM 14324 / JCM 22182 / KY 12970) TaxID=764103 RepID=G7DUK2_MIXOS|nr:uncharacterized protein L969DRAFT_20423 [Mixia osmundae IAM 14324]KEI36404.1 hypothetical protein L969DRAFT_20423 [Mixia osmundae IAM 14324]GAA94262.1 hypothetical protein E5Q_00911 [Mixia osmundae IAM 14324]
MLVQARSEEANFEEGCPDCRLATAQGGCCPSTGCCEPQETCDAAWFAQGSSKLDAVHPLGTGPSDQAMPPSWSGIDWGHEETLKEILDCCCCAAAADHPTPSTSNLAHPREGLQEPLPGLTRLSPITHGRSSLASTSPPESDARPASQDSLYRWLCHEEPCEVPHSHTAVCHPPHLPFVCEWSHCHAAFTHKKELVAHVNEAHLSHMQDASTPEAIAWPTPSSPDKTFVPLQTTQWPTQILPTSKQENVIDTRRDPTPLAQHVLPTDALRCQWDDCYMLPAPLAFPASDAGMPVPGSLTRQETIKTSSTATPPASILMQHVLHDHIEQGLPFSVAGHHTLANGTATHAAQVPEQRGSPVNDLSKFKLDFVPSTPSLDSDTRSIFGSTPASFTSGSSFQTPLTTPTSSQGGPKRRRNPPVTEETMLRRHLHVKPCSHRGKSLPHCAQHHALVDIADQKDGEMGEEHLCKWPGCSAKFSTTAKLMAHLGEEHVGCGKSTYSCQWEGCTRAKEGKPFAQRQKIMRHLQAHVKDRPFKCDICSGSYSEATALAQHRKIHFKHVQEQQEQSSPQARLQAVV